MDAGCTVLDFPYNGLFTDAKVTSCVVSPYAPATAKEKRPTPFLNAVA